MNTVDYAREMVEQGRVAQEQMVAASATTRRAHMVAEFMACLKFMEIGQTGSLAYWFSLPDPTGILREFRNRPMTGPDETHMLMTLPVAIRLRELHAELFP